MNELGWLLLAVVLLLTNALFVAAEFALISARRTEIEPMVARSRPARITLRAMENVTLMLAGAQLGITICSLGLGAVAEPAAAHLIEKPFEALGLPGSLLNPIAFAIALAIVVLLHVVIGEMVPKNIALAGPRRTALLLAPPLAAVVLVLRPAIVLLNLIANGTLRVLRVEPKSEVTSAFTRDEVAALVAESRREGLLDEAEHSLLTGALEFDQRDLSSVSIPLSELVTVPAEVTPAQVEALAASTGFSRFPVRAPAGPDLTGYLHVKDIITVDGRRRAEPVPTETVRPLVRLPAETTLRTGLARLQAARAHLALVTEDGHPTGVAMLEDLLEELVGEIRDQVHRGISRTS